MVCTDGISSCVFHSALDIKALSASLTWASVLQGWPHLFSFSFLLKPQPNGSEPRLRHHLQNLSTQGTVHVSWPQESPGPMRIETSIFVIYIYIYISRRFEIPNGSFFVIRWLTTNNRMAKKDPLWFSNCICIYIYIYRYILTLVKNRRPLLCTVSVSTVDPKMYIHLFFPSLGSLQRPTLSIAALPRFQQAAPHRRYISLTQCQCSHVRIAMYQMTSQVTI